MPKTKPAPRVKASNRRTSVEIDASRIVKTCHELRRISHNGPGHTYTWDDCADLLGISTGTIRTLRKNA